MKKSLIKVLSVICAGALVAAVFQIKVISIGDSEKTVVYISPFGYKPGGSVRADLENELTPLYGEEGVRTERAHGVYQEENAVAYDTAAYEFQYLGRSFGGGDYLSCKVTTMRTLRFDGGEKDGAPAARRTNVYIGYDDGDFRSSERAKILWATLEEDYPDGEAYFDSLALAEEGSSSGLC